MFTEAFASECLRCWSSLRVHDDGAVAWQLPDRTATARPASFQPDLQHLTFHVDGDAESWGVEALSLDLSAPQWRFSCNCCMASWSCMAVLVLSNFTGATVKGVTGFGSAILNLCVWVGFSCAGVDSGTLQQAVVSECLCSEAVAVPLLVMTKARSTCDWRLVTSLAFFGAFGAPIGAALLTHLQAHDVEFVMACIILLVIILHCRLLQKLTECCSSGATSQTCMHELSDSCQASQQHKQAALGSCSTPVSPAGFMRATVYEQCAISIGAAADQSLRGGVHDCNTDGSATPCAQLLTADEPLAVSALHSNGSTSNKILALKIDTAGMSSSSGSSRSLEAAATPMAQADDSSRSQSFLQEQASRTACPDVDFEDEDEDPLLRCHCSATTDAASAHASCTRAPSEPPGTRQCSAQFIARFTLIIASCRAAVTKWWTCSVEPEQRDVILKMFLIGSAAGTASGIMSGMTGMGGPPMMYMYDKLSVPKDTVRGSNAVLGILQFRIIAYAVMGAFVPEDWSLYTACIAAGMIGMYLGDRLAARMNQQAFSQMMVFLMVLCCVLLFASSGGLTSA